MSIPRAVEGEVINVLALSAGVGLSFGFIPVAYEAKRSWKSADRLERSTR